jgi:hypothetical protein
MKRLGLAAVAALSLWTGGCVTPQRGDTPARVSRALPTIGEQVAFDHPDCPVERIRLIRSGPDAPMTTATTADWDICGAVRRYKSFGGGRGSYDTWLDVTSLYPPSSLPAPLAPR